MTIISIDDKINENKRLIWRVINDLDYIAKGVEMDDVYQVGLISLWGAIESYVENDKYDLSTHCVNNIKGDILNYLDKEQRANSRCCGDVEFGIIPPFEDEVVDKMLYDEIEKILTSEEYDTFSDFYLDGMSQIEMGEKYGIARETVNRRLKAVRDKLKDKLEWEE